MPLTDFIRDVPDFPKKGIIFKDITPLLGSPEAFGQVIEAWAARYGNGGIDAIVGIESRGFIFGAALAHRLGRPFLPARKPGKLPWKSIRAEYELEYGTDAIEMHVDAVTPGRRILIVDDLLATGGTAAAAASLVELAGGVVVECAFVIELAFLKARATKLGRFKVHSLITYDGE
jgi:adenine phosphoribosyltransferase